MELGSCFLPFFFSFGTASVSTLWITSTSIPVPMKPHPSELNHYHPVTLASIKSGHPYLCQTTKFIYKAQRGTEGAVASPLRSLPPTTNSFTRLFTDFSSALNTIQRHQLNIPHFSSIGYGAFSVTAPQGWVLSPCAVYLPLTYISNTLTILQLLDDNNSVLGY